MNNKCDSYEIMELKRKNNDLKIGKRATVAFCGSLFVCLIAVNFFLYYKFIGKKGVNKNNKDLIKTSEYLGSLIKKSKDLERLIKTSEDLEHQILNKDSQLVKEKNFYTQKIKNLEENLTKLIEDLEKEQIIKKNEIKSKEDTIKELKKENKESLNEMVELMIKENDNDDEGFSDFIKKINYDFVDKEDKYMHQKKIGEINAIIKKIKTWHTQNFKNEKKFKIL